MITWTREARGHTSEELSRLRIDVGWLSPLWAAPLLDGWIWAVQDS